MFMKKLSKLIPQFGIYISASDSLEEQEYIHLKYCKNKLLFIYLIIFY
jgi:hypothetical protein